VENNHRQGKKATAEVKKNKQLKKTTLAVALLALPIVVFFGSVEKRNHRQGKKATAEVYG
jgi:hypothetical protein